MKEKAIIIGAGTYGQVYAEYLEKDYEVVGFVDDNIELTNIFVNGYKVLGNVNWLFNECNCKVNIFVPIGNNKVRVSLLSKLEQEGFNTPSYIHPSVNMHNSVKVGKAVYVLPACNFMPLSVIEDYVMISMGVNVAHHTILGKGSFYSQGNNVGASIKIKENAYSGIGVTIMTGVKEIGANSLLGAGAIIIRDVPDHAVVVGNPGKIIKYNEATR
ncbi:acetyltransferase [Myroides odoratimimus]|uniref:acetyltransferase n=1 Tax=Myroides odoratimimus TaxID=76832 RepID=UPI002574FD1A|nr:acetyltransferase [Myroides odoratimimus]MDM1066150.1 acetyltransferase [Myroides odoratimimus]